MATTQNTSSLISSVYKSRAILLELMNMQGYNIDEYEGFSVNEVNTMKLNNQLDMILEKNKILAKNILSMRISLRFTFILLTISILLEKKLAQYILVIYILIVSFPQYVYYSN